MGSAAWDLPCPAQPTPRLPFPPLPSPPQLPAVWPSADPARKTAANEFGAPISAEFVRVFDGFAAAYDARWVGAHSGWGLTEWLGLAGENKRRGEHSEEPWDLRGGMPDLRGGMPDLRGGMPDGILGAMPTMPGRPCARPPW